MKSNYLISFFIVIAIIIAGAGCKKDMQDCPAPPVPVKPRFDSVSACRIEQVRTVTIENDDLIANFYYNDRNDPTSIKFVNNLEYNQFFKYDDQHRLTGHEYASSFTDSTLFLTWHKYTYVGDSVIIDTAFINGFGWPGERPVTYERFRVSEYSLDSIGRVVSEKKYQPDGSFTTLRYPYNEAGNLNMGSSSIEPYIYDLNLRNMRKTNKIWQLMDLNYSANPLSIESGPANEQGFPVIWYLNAGVPPFLGFAPEGEPVYISYSCDGNGGSSNSK
jgi:hypothetical protein